MHIFTDANELVLYTSKVNASITTNNKVYLFCGRVQRFYNVIDMTTLLKLTFNHSVKFPRLTPNLHAIYVPVTLTAHYGFKIQLTQTEDPF